MVEEQYNKNRDLINFIQEELTGNIGRATVAMVYYPQLDDATTFHFQSMAKQGTAQKKGTTYVNVTQIFDSQT